VTVTPPGATTASAQIPLTMAPCNNGTVEVSPVYAATAS
jgi:adenosine deaminase